jgi:hypothetical protein
MKMTSVINKFARTSVFFACFIALVSCASKPTIYVYGKYLSEVEVAQLERKLIEENFNVKVNELDFPTTISTNAILYSFMLKEPSTIDTVTEISEQLNMPIKSISSLKEGNHWYTKNALALFIFPQSTDKLGDLLMQDLVHRYQAEDCDSAIELHLYKDGSYHLSNIDESLGQQTGRWHYRQYPYLELQEKGANYSSHYFEISQSLEKDQISEIKITQLIPLSSYIIPQDCLFRFGLRQ